MEGITIHLAPLALGTFWGIPFTNTLFTALLISVSLVVVALFIKRSLLIKPSKFQTVIEALIVFPYEFVRDTLQDDRLARKLFPLIITIFIFILAVNWFGLLPIVESIGLTNTGKFIPIFYPGTTDLNFTLALTLIVFFAIEVAGIATLGAISYGKKFITFRSPLAFIVGLIELMSEFARLISFSFRLFGNIFAGKVLILVIMAFIPIFLPVPFLGFELFVGFIQAAIFALLTLFFAKIAVEEVRHESHKDVKVTPSSEEGGLSSEAI